jgi:hypothetical protein
MSIASEIERIKTNIANAYTTCEGKGATLPAILNSENLVNCISSITGGEATGYIPYGLMVGYSAYGCEGGTTWEDFSGNGRNMTMYNNPTFDSENLAWNFNGTNQYGDVNFTAPPNDFTLEIYGFAPEQSTVAELVAMFGISFNYYAGYGISVKLDSTSYRATGYIASSTNSAKTVQINPSSVLQLGVKTKAIFRRHATDGLITITLMNVNGREDKDNTVIKNSITPNTQKFSIGTTSLRSDITAFSKGSYHAVRLYERCLTDEEVAQNHAEDVRIYGE